VALDSNRVGDPVQTRWLADELAAPQPAGTWTVVAMHHPAFSAGYHGSSDAVRREWAPLFAEHDVPLVLAGHDHDYQRSFPQDGVTYVVSGAGAKVRDAGHEDFTAVSTSTLHYLDLLVYENRIDGRAIDQQGRLLDSFTLER
jgi:3',5'-cyclic AMP phosphodiesterase CpdA